MGLPGVLFLFVLITSGQWFISSYVRKSARLSIYAIKSVDPMHAPPSMSIALFIYHHEFMNELALLQKGIMKCLFLCLNHKLPMSTHANYACSTGVINGRSASAVANFN